MQYHGYFAELELIYQNPDAPRSKEEWFRLLDNEGHCHADVVSLLAERDALKAQIWRMLSGDGNE